MKRIQTRAGIFIAFVLLVLSCAMFLSAHPAKAEEIQPVHGIYWIGKMRTDKKATINGQSVYLKKKEKVLVVSRPYDRQGNSIVEKDGVRIPVPYNSISYITDACTINQGDYNTTTKEYFVNVQHHLTSKTRYLIWASLDKQRLNLFEGSGNGGDWKLIRVSKCSSGSAQSPSRTGFGMDIGFKKRVYRYSNPTFSATVQYFMEFSGSGFHKWAGGGRKKNLGKHPVSHSCIRLEKKHAIWMYKNVPAHTRVVVY